MILEAAQPTALCHLCAGLPRVENHEGMWYVYCSASGHWPYSTASDEGLHCAVQRWDEQETTALADRLDLPTLPAGPWLLEPNAASWVDAVTGLRCLIIRHRLGTLAGYVHNPTRVPTACVDARGIHRGLTGNGPLSLFDDELRWVSFDCAHSGDLMPMDLLEHGPVASGTYRTMEYVRGLCAELARRVYAAHSAMRPIEDCHETQSNHHLV